MNLLIIGGTVFLGRHLVTAASASGHIVTTFNRGNHNLPEQKEIERIIGDREKSLDALKGRKWDAVIDVCGMEPEVVAKSADFLKDSVEKYVFISSISAFDNFREIGMTERSRAKLLPPEAEQDYGSKKAHCEKIVSEIYNDKALNIRPGLIVGAYDESDRFTYWVRRVSQGGVIIAPGRPERQIQFIDVRDLAEWIIRMVEAGMHGTYCATGPAYTLSMEQFLQSCKQTCKSNARFVWLSDEMLSKAEVQPWVELPLWIPDSNAEFIGFTQIDCRKAQNCGLSYRTIDETIEYTLNWDSKRDQSVPLKAGLPQSKESALLSPSKSMDR